MNSQNKLRQIALALVALALISPAIGQVREREIQEPEAMQIELFMLQNVAADSAEQTVRRLLGDQQDLTLSAEQATNGLLVRGSKESLELVRQLLDRLDAASKPEEDDDATPRLIVYDLKYTDAKTAYEVIVTMLSDVPDTRIALDPRLNRMIVSAPTQAHKSIADIMQTIDVAATAPESMVFNTGKKTEAGTTSERLMATTAADFNVNVELIPELDVAIVRGARENVSNFAKHVDQVMAVANRPGSAASAASASTKSYTVRVIWLADLESEASRLPSDLQPLADRAAEFGINNLQVVGQLIAMTNASAEVETQFDVEGQPNPFHSGVNGRFAASGTISPVATGSDKLIIYLDLSANLIPIDNSSDTVASLSMHLTPGQPVMIASAPIGGYQSIFVVEVSVSE